jgi:diguanylate cyclase (GGDEF)-like protein/PAS domain S-box-containing protein
LSGCILELSEKQLPIHDRFSPAGFLQGTMNNPSVDRPAVHGKRISPSTLLPFALVIAMVLLIVFSGFLWNRYSHYRLLQSRLATIEGLCADFVYYDEVLTMSARMAAASGNLSWEERYRGFDEKLSAALRQAKELAPEDLNDVATFSVDKANDKLVDMERRAFLLVHQGNLQEADALLDGTSYRDQKEIYRKGIDTIRAEIEERAGKTLASFQRQTVFGAAAFLVVLLILLVSMVGGTRSLQANFHRIQRAEAELRTLNESLEARVAERTAVLSRTTDALNNELAARKDIETALRETAENFQAGIDSAQDGIIVIDSSGNITSWNVASERMFGYSKAEAMGRDVCSLIVPDRYREAHATHFAEFRETGKGGAIRKTTELHGLRKNGTEFSLDMSLSALSLGGKRGAMSIVRDTSERKRAEEAIQKTNEKLAGMVTRLENLGAQSDNLRAMGGFLLSCSTIDEIHPVITQSMKKLLPGSAGAMFLLSPSTTDLESACTWGGFPEDADDMVFSPDACWGLTRGGLYVVDDMQTGVICTHLHHPAITAYACLPLMAKSEVLGLLHIRKQSAAGPEGVQAWVTGVRDVAPELGELLSLSVSNIRLREKLSIQSIRDPLTGLFNRRYMEESFQKEISRAARKQVSIAVVMLDIDHFKTFNDKHGHAAGDAVLVALAGFLKGRMRGGDVACRYGGEEFALILPECSLEDGVRRSSQLGEEFRTVRVSYGGGTLDPITLSMGVASYPLHGARPEELLGAADAALYRAKQEGRDRVVPA